MPALRLRYEKSRAERVSVDEYCLSRVTRVLPDFIDS